MPLTGSSVSPAHCGDRSDHHSHGHAPNAHRLDEDLAEILDLDAELFAPYLASVTGRVANLLGGAVEVSEIVDVGAGSGTGTLALLERFPIATVTAVDSSSGMLTELARKVAAQGVADRVRTLKADACSELPGISGADLIWASASLHHLNDPAGALAGIRAALRPGGLLAVAELDGMPRFLPEDVPASRPGLEARCRDALSALHAAQVPHLGADWGTMLTAAGFEVEEERTEHLELRAPMPALANRYARLVLKRVRAGVAGRIGAVDTAALDALLDGGPQDVGHRTDLVVRSTRHFWAARRPVVGH